MIKLRSPLKYLRYANLYQFLMCELCFNMFLVKIYLLNPFSDTEHDKFIPMSVVINLIFFAYLSISWGKWNFFVWNLIINWLLCISTSENFVNLDKNILFFVDIEKIWESYGKFRFYISNHIYDTHNLVYIPCIPYIHTA